MFNLAVSVTHPSKDVVRLYAKGKIIIQSANSVSHKRLPLNTCLDQTLRLLNGSTNR